MIGCRRPYCVSRGGFTLIEMLVVIIVILLLSMILLRSIAHFGEEGRRKKAVADLEQLQNALNEYFTEYGNYPPVNTMGYEWESVTNQPAALKTWLAARNNPDAPDEFFPDTNMRSSDWPKSTHPDWSLGYRYGLVSYLWPRDRGGQVHWYDEDSARDKAAKGKWASFLAEVGVSGGYATHTGTASMAMGVIWSNNCATVCDPWGNEFQYRCPPPYVRYRLWSMGPDGSSAPGFTKDDVALQTWDE
jgi:prepilin-type N-terminal cleavage/methylation domain-containing protein